MKAGPLFSNGLPDRDFWAGKRVLVTGHTGFKGSWLSLWLHRLGAEVTGLALPPEGELNLFTMARIGECCRSHIIDLRDASAVRAVVAEARPEIVLHLAAQALVRRSYRDPAGTFATNVQGTVNLLDAVAEAGSARAILVVTSDKVYANDETGHAFREEDRLGGHDPYSLSKAACELVVNAYRAARFSAAGTAIATARGGNVIGGGDYSEDRIVPDIVRAAMAREAVMLRNPRATRPWQHVLDCLAGYLIFAELLADNREDYPHALNIGPEPGLVFTVGEIAEVLSRNLGAKPPVVLGAGIGEPMREMKTLAIDPLLSRTLGIRDHLPGNLAFNSTMIWYRHALEGRDVRGFSEWQIDLYGAPAAPGPP